MTSDVNIVHVVFKTHLDVGFTDYAHKVVERYFSQFIPASLQLAEQLRQQDSPERFRWTVGSWLVYEYLERAKPQERARMENAIEAGDIKWHALPVTTHTELIDASLFEYGLSLSQELDRRFGKQTIAAKMTDVPGHTRAMVPLLANAGVKFLHIGVNEASTPPDVPPIFIWKDSATDTDLMVMYHNSYGDVTVIPSLHEAVAIILTGDNMGPQTIDEIRAIYQQLQARFPEAKIIASTLDEFAQKAILAQADFPVITQEIGDTWIQGVGTDPVKVRDYRALARLRQQWLAEGRVSADDAGLKAFSRKLLMVPEHTWGMDLKTHLPDYEHYTSEALAEQRQTALFKAFEASWQEQRAYLDQAVDALAGSPLQQEAQTVRDQLVPRQPDLSQYTLIDKTQFETAHFDLAFDAQTGALTHLIERSSGTVWSDSDHQLAKFTYELFSQSDYDRYWSQYIRNSDSEEIREWAYPDNMKPGLPITTHQEWLPVVDQIYFKADTDADEFLLALTLPDDSRQYGAPAKLYLSYRFPQAKPIVEISLSWFDKPVCRLAEALWLSFNPRVTQPENWRMDKMGRLISPLDVISHGNRTLHAVQGGVTHQSDQSRLWIDSLDAPLVAPGKRSLLDFHNQQPDLAHGIHFNLYNNIWGTNFPMWFGEDMTFRFVFQPEPVA